ncbi:MAG: hypothetical protein CMI53_00755 [Parcubacteria group bacterium]|nr:hypothetical protein [Parcubacteria group bacterium]|tara:strand:- start:1093 stop:1608 length:516 start_codon:yes stop_codon:yes gene_type:complete
MTEEEFRKLVEIKVATGSSFVGAVYQAMDEAAAEEDQSKWACHKGCSACCYQMVHVTEGETTEIINYLNDLNRTRRKRIMKRVWKKIDSYWKWFQRMGGTGNQQLADDLWVRAQWDGKPCTFLNNSGACSIHKVRPFDCRSTYSTVVCNVPEYRISDGQRLPYQYEAWANK